MNSTWFLYALFGMLSFSAMILIFKKLTALNVKTPVIMLFLALFLFVFFGLHLLSTSSSPAITRSVLWLIALAAFFSYLGNLLYLKSIEIAPNPGYSAAIIGLQAAVIAVASVFLFSSNLSLLKGVGVVLAVIGAILLVL